jgi:hypothetical protein
VNKWISELLCCVIWLHSSAVYVKLLIVGIQFLDTGSALFVKDVVDEQVEPSVNYVCSDIKTCDRERSSRRLYCR